MTTVLIRIYNSCVQRRKWVDGHRRVEDYAFGVRGPRSVFLLLNDDLAS
jgi:hypothetical protein